MRRVTPILIADRDELLNDFTTAAAAASAQPDRPHGPGQRDSAAVQTAAGGTEDTPATEGGTVSDGDDDGLRAPAAETPGLDEVQHEASLVTADLADKNGSDGETSVTDVSAVEMSGVAAGAPPVEVLFSDLGLSEPIVRAVEEMGYRHPTPIQAQAIPVVLAGRDVLGVAQTGTGKTAGFTLPMLDILAGRRSRARMPRSLILEPTRELALQVAENFVKYGKYLKLNHALLIGGESLNDQKSALMKGVDVLIATPGRLLDLFERGGMMLTDARILVIDEADRMLDMGFIPDVEKIVSFLPADRQTLFFSATMAGEIRRLADAFLRDPKEITVSRAASVAPLITEGLAIVAEDDKRRALREIIRAEAVQNALIFCNRKRDVDVLNKSLAKHGFSVGALHGDLAQSVRFATLERFKAGEIRLLVCSDVAARGIDIGGLSHVFNFDVPHHSEDYVHRIGRTGRAGLTGHAYTIAAPADRANLEAIEKLTGHSIPPMSVAGIPAAEWEESDGKRRRGGRKSGGGRVAEAPPSSAAPVVVSAPAEPVVVETAAVEGVPMAAAAARRPEGRRRGRGRGGDRPRQGDAAQGEAAASAPVQPDMAPRAAEERAPARFRDEPAAPGGRRDAAASVAPSEDRSRGEDRFRRDGDRFRRDGRRRDEDLGPSVLGFGGEVPAFMQLPTRASRLERLAQAPVAAAVQRPARVVPIAPAPVAEPMPVEAEPVLVEADAVEAVAEPVVAAMPAATPATAEPAVPAAIDVEPATPAPVPVPEHAVAEVQAATEAAVPDTAVPLPESAAALEPAAIAVDKSTAPRQRAPRRAPATPRAPRVRKPAAAPVVAEAVPDPDAVAIRTYRPARDPAVKRAAHSPAVPAKRSRRLLGGKVELLEEPAAVASDTPGTANETAPE